LGHGGESFLGVISRPAIINTDPPHSNLEPRGSPRGGYEPDFTSWVQPHVPQPVKPESPKSMGSGTHSSFLAGCALLAPSNATAASVFHFHRRRLLWADRRPRCGHPGQVNARQAAASSRGELTVQNASPVIVLCALLIQFAAILQDPIVIRYGGSARPRFAQFIWRRQSPQRVKSVLETPILTGGWPRVNYSSRSSWGQIFIDGAMAGALRGWSSPSWPWSDGIF